MRVLWEEHQTEEYWGFLLIDARNAFNEENQTAMLWGVRHERPSGAQFTFNCYRHWAMIVVRDTGDGSGHFLHSKEGVTQGDPLAMIVYVIGVLPLIRELRNAHPESHSHGTMMTRLREGCSSRYRSTFGIYKQGDQPGDITQSRPRAS